MALHYYKKAYESSNIPELKEKYEHIKKQHYRGEKLAIFCQTDLDRFIHEIADVLTHVYDVKIAIPKDSADIISVYSWADIVWLEWANELTVEITNELPKGNKKSFADCIVMKRLIIFQKKLSGRI